MAEEDTKRKKRRWQLNDRYLSDFVDNGTLGGIVHVFRGDSKIRRLLWGGIFIGCLIACIVLFSLSSKRFADRPTASTITVVSLSREGIPFPGVTICNLNLARNFSDILSNRTYQLMNHLFNADESFELSGFNTSEVIDICHNVIPNSPENIRKTTIWQSQSPEQSLNELIHYCGFVSGIGAKLTPCKQDFRPVLTSAGICYTFNSTDRLVTTTGLRYGLKLILNIDQETRPSFNGKSGVKVVVHDGNDIARPNLYGINVPPGQAIDIGARQRISIDETDEAGCIQSRDLPFVPDVDYSQFACRLNALNEHIAQNDTCGCIIQPDRPETGPYVNTPNCTFNQSCCLLNEYVSFNPDTDCPLPCHFEYYEYSSSYSSFPNGRLLNDLASSLNQSTDEIKEKFLSVNVFIDDLQVTTTITQYTFGIEALIGELGGQLGLFLGISIITIFELLVLLFDELKRCLPKSCRKKIEKFEEKIELPEIEADSKESDSNKSLEESAGEEHKKQHKDRSGKESDHDSTKEFEI